MNTKKIAVLEKAIGMLEGGFDYKWSSSNRCNCGMILQACGLNLTNGVGSYEDYSRSNQRKCEITGLPFGQIQETFLSLGFTQREILDLEWLGNPKICEMIGEKSMDLKERRVIENCKYEEKEYLLKYLRAWVSILKEQDAKETPEVKERIIYVSVPVTISEQAKELITNN